MICRETFFFDNGTVFSTAFDYGDDDEEFPTLGDWKHPDGKWQDQDAIGSIEGMSQSDNAPAVFYDHKVKLIRVIVAPVASLLVDNPPA